jgi:hypothetical protein
MSHPQFEARYRDTQGTIQLHTASTFCHDIPALVRTELPASPNLYLAPRWTDEHCHLRARSALTAPSSSGRSCPRYVAISGSFARKRKRVACISGSHCSARRAQGSAQMQLNLCISQALAYIISHCNACCSPQTVSTLSPSVSKAVHCTCIN